MLRFVPVRFHNYYLILSSLIFYVYAGWGITLWLLVSSSIHYIFVLLVRKYKNKRYLYFGVSVSLAGLLLSKYLVFLGETVHFLLKVNISYPNLILPLGISFYTFQEIAYLIDTYRGKLDKYSASDYFCYILFFPKLIMGPLAKADLLLPQLLDADRRKWNTDQFTEGVQFFVGGLAKKLLLADVFAECVNFGISNLHTIQSMDVIITMLAYTFQIYFDFSGYSDMAIGIGKMMNIDIPANFNMPYRACSIGEFWKKWHITLTDFFREYVYIPLGGNRKGKIRQYGNMMLVFLLSGIWHGANWTFVLWGILHGACQVIERIGGEVIRIPKVIRWITTFVIINILWLLFRTDSIHDWVYAIKTIVSFDGISISEGLKNTFYKPETELLVHVLRIGPIINTIQGGIVWLYMILGITGAALIPAGISSKVRRSYAGAIIYAMLFIYCLICLGGETSFVYYNF